MPHRTITEAQMKSLFAFCQYSAELNEALENLSEIIRTTDSDDLPNLGDCAAKACYAFAEAQTPGDYDPYDPCDDLRGTLSPINGA